VGWYCRKVARPGRVRRGFDLKICEIGFASESEQGNFAFLHATFQVVHYESRFFHVRDEEFGLRARDFETHVKPRGFGNIDPACKSWTVEKLPVAACVEDGRVLHRVGIAGCMLAEIDLLVILAIGIDTNVKSKETALCWRGDVDVNNGVPHLEIFQDGCAAVDEKSFAALIFGELGAALEIPAR